MPEKLTIRGTPAGQTGAGGSTPFAREQGLFARGLLWVTLVVAVWLSLEASLDWVHLPKGNFVSVLGWAFPGEGWGSARWLHLARGLLWTGAPLWLFGSVRMRQTGAWMCVAGLLLLGSVYWENLPWFRHKYVPPFWLLLLLAIREHAEPERLVAPRWVREGAVFVLAAFYGGAGICKLLGSGWAWGDGVALQLWFWKLGDESSSLRDQVLASAPLSHGLATGALLLELAVPLAFIFPALRLWTGIGLMAMHVGIDQNFHIDFRSQMLLVAVILFPWEAQVRTAQKTA